MSLLFRVLHSTARALADLFCTPPTITDAHVDASAVSTATLYLRLVASSGYQLPVSALSPEICAHCSIHRLTMDLPNASTSTPPRPKTPPATIKSKSSSDERSISHGIPLPSSNSDRRDVLPPTPTRPWRRIPTARRSRPQLLYPSTPRLDISPPDFDLGLAYDEIYRPGNMDSELAPKINHGLGLGISGLGVLPRTRPADPGAPSIGLLRDLCDALASPVSTIGSPPALSIGSLSPAETISPPPLAFSPQSYTASIRNSLGSLSNEYDSDDDRIFLSRPRPRPPTRSLKPRAKIVHRPSTGSLSASPVPRSPLSSPSLSSIAPSPDISSQRKLRSSLSIRRPPPSRVRSLRALGAFDHDTIASAARRVSVSSIGSCESVDRPRWKY